MKKATTTYICDECSVRELTGHHIAPSGWNHFDRYEWDTDGQDIHITKKDSLDFCSYLCANDYITRVGKTER